MYFETINGDKYLTIDKGLIKRKLRHLANEAIEWLIAGGIMTILITAIYYGNLAYTYLTSLF